MIESEKPDERVNLQDHIRENVVNGRSIDQYEHYLSFDREILKGKKVLNFGCGGSNIGSSQSIKRLGTEWIDMDILPNPISVHENRFDNAEHKFLKGVARQRVINTLETDEAWKISSTSIKYIDNPSSYEIESARRKVMQDRIKRTEDDQLSFNSFDEDEDKIFGIDGRNFIQFNGEEIQIKEEDGTLARCPDNHFDYGLLSWVIHQIPENDFPKVFRELMRTCKNIIISPIWQKNIFDIQRLVDEYDYEIKSISALPESNDFKAKPVLTSERSIENLTNFGFMPKLYPDVDEGEVPKTVNAHGAGVIFLHKNLV